MKLLKIAALAAVMGIGSAQAASVAFSSVTGTPGVTGIAFAHDGNYPELGQYWQEETAWWDAWLTPNQYLVFAFDKPYQITGFTASLDNNDNYRIDLSTDGEVWTPYAVVLGEDYGDPIAMVDGGMDTFAPASVATRDYFSFARVRATGGDKYYSVGELQFSGVAAPIPEPETLALMLGGIAALGLKLRRRAG